MSTRLRVLVPVLLLALVAACSGEGSPVATSTPSPTASSPAPTPSPTLTAAPSTAAVPAMGKLSAWSGCGGGFQCATLTVPLDDAKPRLGTIAIALTRHKATGGPRIGSLIANPGGPGASAVEWMHGAYNRFPAEIRKRFDLVAFDPRGIGKSAPVRCLSAARLDDFFHIDPAPDSPAERVELTTGNKEFTTGCQRRSARVLPYVATTIVAQDLDRVRQAVGDTKLTYLGYSYGTAVGASYLDQFPTRVRAMVLDGALDPAMTWDQFLSGQSRGFDEALKAFLAHCEKSRCAFREAVSGDLAKAFDALAAKVETSPLPGDGARTVGPSEFTLGVGAGLYSRNNGWPAIAQGLAAAAGGDGSILMQLNDSYLERSADGYANTVEANFAVNCLDRPWPRTEAPYYALAAQVSKSYPRFGPMIALSGMACATWPVDATGTPHAVTAPGSPPVVVIGTTRDPATPFSWSKTLAGTLAKGVLLTHVGDGHTIYRSGAPGCILRPVNSYLISLKAPAAATC